MPNSRYLLDERPLTVLPTLCSVLGITRAVILQEIHWLLGQPRTGVLIDRVELPDGRVFEGSRWVWNTADQWREFFGWLEADSIRKHLGELEALKVLVSFTPKSMNRTKHYTLDYISFERLIDEHPSGKKFRMQQDKNAACIRHRIEEMHSENNATSSIVQKSQSDMSAEMTTQEPAADAAGVITSAPLQETEQMTQTRDGLTDYFDLATKAKHDEKVAMIHKWKGNDQQREMCAMFAAIFQVDVTKSDGAKWMAGAKRLIELGVTRAELEEVYQIARAANAYLTHPGAVYEWVKGARLKSKAEADGASTTTTVEPAGLAILRGMAGAVQS